MSSSQTGKIRVLVVEDSITVRKRLVEVLAGEASFEVVGEASDGRQAGQMCQALRPDVVTMDMMLPVMTGLEATEFIMAHCPTPILVVSSSTNRGELFRTYEALAAGAVDVLEKPRGDESDGAWEQQFLSHLKLVSRIRVITHLRGRLRSLTPAVPARAIDLPALPAGNGRRAAAAIAIGASTGGPGAVVEILRALPVSFATPILLVVHIGESFAGAFTDWLAGRTDRRVTFALDGEPLSALRGRIVMAPPNRHMIMRGGRVGLSSEGERHSCRPSVDVLFETVARELRDTAVACLLTGMGRDGAAGLLDIHLAGGFTIAQDEASSVVWGMPREAVLLGAADRVLPLGEIAPTLVRAAAGLEARAR